MKNFMKAVLNEPVEAAVVLICVVCILFAVGGIYLHVNEALAVSQEIPTPTRCARVFRVQVNGVWYLVTDKGGITPEVTK